jgi:hypothetical protein
MLHMQMAMETPNMDPDSIRTIMLRWVDIGTTIVFWVEAGLKIIAFSFKAYISYFTNKVLALPLQYHVLLCSCCHWSTNKTQWKCALS